jgi:hypothetical protein
MTVGTTTVRDDLLARIREKRVASWCSRLVARSG